MDTIEELQIMREALLELHPATCRLRHESTNRQGELLPQCAAGKTRLVLGCAHNSAHEALVAVCTRLTELQLMTHLTGSMVVGAITNARNDIERADTNAADFASQLHKTGQPEFGVELEKMRDEHEWLVQDLAERREELLIIVNNALGIL